MSRLIDADKYMNHLRANINTTSDIIAKYIKKDKPIGTVADGGQIGYLNALQWARASLECDCYTVKAIPLDKIKKAREEIDSKYDGFANIFCEREQGRNEMIEEILEILDKLIESEEK
jgi:hypothetical protein